MKMVFEGDWSIGVNRSSANALSDAKLLKRIGRELRSVYAPLVHEPVPERLATLLERLDERERDAAES